MKIRLRLRAASDPDFATEVGFDSMPNIEVVTPDGASLNGNAEENEPESTDTDSFDDSHTGTDDAFEEIDYGREFQDYLDPGYRTQEIEYKDDAPSFEQFLTHSPNLSEHLEWQVNLLDLTDAEERAAAEIIGNLGRRRTAYDSARRDRRRQPLFARSCRIRTTKAHAARSRRLRRD